MDKEQKATLRSMLELLREVSQYAEQAEAGILKQKKPLPDDIEEQLELVRKKLQEYEENDRNLLEEGGIDQDLLRKIMAPRHRLPTERRKVYDRSRRMINNLRSRANFLRLQIDYAKALEENPKLKLNIPDKKEAPIREMTKQELGRKEESEETPEERRQRLREAKAKGKKQFRKVGGFRNWKKL